MIDLKSRMCDPQVRFCERPEESNPSGLLDRYETIATPVERFRSGIHSSQPRPESRRLNFIRERFGLDKRRSGIQPVFSTDVCSAGNPWWRCAYHGLPADIPPGMKACALMPGYQCQRAGDEICTSFPPGSLRSRFANKLHSIEQ